MAAVAVAIAHRGDPVGQREDTLAAFVSAVAAGADMVELDVQLTLDGEVVVLHDATLQRLWGIDRRVNELELAQLPCGERGIPTFAEVLATVEVPLMVDFTSGNVVGAAWHAVSSAGAVDRCLFVTGNVTALRALRAIAPGARTGLTWGVDGDPPVALLAELGAAFWNPRSQLVSAERVERAHQAGHRVSTWTVDEVEAMHRVLTAGVDAVVTNQIARLRTVLAGR
jgi:glycerophosphoryl diester phosphodiesterase